MRINTNRTCQDFFYVCGSHLVDKGFASPVVDAEAEAAKKKKELMDQEIAKIKEEYEEKQRKKKAKKKSKDEDKDKKKNDDDDDGKAEKERDDKVSFPFIQPLMDSSSNKPKIKALQADPDAGQAKDAPRVYALQKWVSRRSPTHSSAVCSNPARSFYQMRIDRLRNLEIAKRSQQRVKDPTFFPAAPKGDIA